MFFKCSALCFSGSTALREQQGKICCDKIHFICKQNTDKIYLLFLQNLFVIPTKYILNVSEVSCIFSCFVFVNLSGPAMQCSNELMHHLYLRNEKQQGSYITKSSKRTTCLNWPPLIIIINVLVIIMILS